MNGKANPPRRHHYVPRFYLEGFTDSNGVVWVYRKGAEKVFSSSPEGVGYEKHYNTFRNAQGEKDSYSVEEMLAKIEGEASGVFRKLRGFSLPNKEERLILMGFMALMHLRVPIFREHLESTVNQVYRMLSKESARDVESVRHGLKRYEEETGEGADITAEEVQEVISGDGLKWVVPNEWHLKMLKNVPEIAAILSGMHWFYLKAPNETKFVTSDNPVLYGVPANRGSSYFGGGLLDENIEVVFPISREMVCVGGWKEGFKRELGAAPAAIVEMMNGRMITGCLREVYAWEKSKTLFDWVQKYKDSAPKVVVQ